MHAPNSVPVRRLFVAALLPLLAPLALAAAPVAQIYQPKSGLAKGWSATQWGNLALQPASTVRVLPDGATSLLITPAESSAPYAGVQITAGLAAAIDLDAALRERGEVHLQLHNGFGSDGKPALDQMVQVMLSFQPAGAKPLNGKYQQVLLQPVSDSGDNSGWQKIVLPIAEQLQGRVDAATPVKLRGVYLQFIDQPQASVLVGACSLESGSAR